MKLSEMCQTAEYVWNQTNAQITAGGRPEWQRVAAGVDGKYVERPNSKINPAGSMKGSQGLYKCDVDDKTKGLLQKRNQPALGQ